jgi:Skp family chaperone for outer membrane proteins
MNKTILSTALVAIALTAPAASQAQQLPPAVVAVVNVEQIVETCTVCATANAQLQAQIAALQTRAQQLQTQIQAEEQALTAIVNALPQGQQPDAPTQTRIQAFQAMQQNGQNEINGRRDQIQRNAAFVRQQEGARIRPAVMTVMQQRGATIVIDRAAAIEIAPTVDVTAAVLAIVNQNSTPLGVNAPAQAPAAGAPPAPAAPAGTTPPRPRPQGR